MTIEAFKLNHRLEGINWKGELHPPKKITVKRKLMNMMCEYSAKKNNAKDIAGYSTL